MTESLDVVRGRLERKEERGSGVDFVHEEKEDERGMKKRSDREKLREEVGERKTRRKERNSQKERKKEEFLTG